MSSIDSASMGAPSASPFAAPEETPLSRWDQLFSSASERLNPILVKEARQSLKSRQFLVTFSLLLLFCWGWSVAGVAIMYPDIYWAPRGNWMLMGYIWILNFPLLVIVPFSAFRSLASELEDGTYELLSISTLTPQQIIAGKLGSAFLQMLVHLSALAPCIAFTYLLSGVDIILIGLLLWYVFFGSLVLSVLGLLLATLTDVRGWQIVLSVMLILALFGVFMFASGNITMLLGTRPAMGYDDPDFWMGNAAFITIGLCVLALLFYSAAARITFASENRSTPLRVVMFVTQAVIVGWLGLAFWQVTDSDFAIVASSLMAVYWGIMGMFLVGEWPELSERVKRSLPSSELGRMFFTWFNPGPGSGYLFTISNMLAITLMLWMAMLYFVSTSFVSPTTGGRFNDNWFWYSLLVLCYVTIYLGIGRLLIALLRRWFHCELFAGFLLQIVILVLGCILPPLVQLILMITYYTPLQIPNVIWTLAECTDDGLDTITPLVPLLLVPTAAMVFLVNLTMTWREVRLSRQEAPQRVLEDDAALAIKPREPTSPWDLEDTE